MANRCLVVMICIMVLSTTMFVQVSWAEEIGQIKTLTGDVYIVRNNMQLRAQAGDLLQKADAVTTGPESSVGITFIDGSKFSMGPDSHIKLEEFYLNSTTQDGKFLTEIKRGTLAVITGSISKRSPESMKIKAPPFVLGTSGTKFLVKVVEKP
jgi:hypothetical protein